MTDAEGSQDAMSDQPLTDEKLKDRVIEQDLAGDFIKARHTIERMVDRRYLREPWQAILSFQRNHGDVRV